MWVEKLKDYDNHIVQCNIKTALGTQDMKQYVSKQPFSYLKSQIDGHKSNYVIVRDRYN